VTHDSQEPTRPTPIPSELHAVIAAANAGDTSALPALRRALAADPDLIDRLGDLAGHVERGLVALAAGPSLAASEAITAHLAKLRAELGEAAASPLEKLLVRRVVLCWLACHQAEVERVGLLQGNAPEALRAAADRRVDWTHARLLASAKALATVRRLVRPGLSPVELAMALVPESRPGVASRLRAHAATPY
jgi:hypothetical protein